MAKLVATVDGAKLTDTLLKDASKLFSEHYGIWGSQGFGKPGKFFLQLISSQLIGEKVVA